MPKSTLALFTMERTLTFVDSADMHLQCRTLRKFKVALVAWMWSVPFVFSPHVIAQNDLLVELCVTLQAGKDSDAAMRIEMRRQA
mmetsp:Transcript_4479/g.8919  ORF Transcript_4479/g.8919 Transcript_4479/m.8919 type:complete len:85 (-) Transcript_4479:431-685(-)